MFDDNIPEQRRSRKVTWLLIILPVWLLVSGGGALWLYFHEEKKSAEVEAPRTVTTISADEIEATMSKILTFIGERNASSPVGAKGLGSMMSMIDGTLGPGNTGYAVERLVTPPSPAGSWPVLVVKIHGRKNNTQPLWVVTPCDSQPGSPGAVANASGVVAVMAVARDLAATPLDRSVCFVFTPHGIDAKAPLEDTLRILRERIGKAPGQPVLVVERMGLAEKLRISGEGSISASLLPADQAEDGGELRREDSNTAFLLKGASLPVALATTGPAPEAGSPDAEAPQVANLVHSASSLKQLILKMSEMAR